MGAAAVEAAPALEEARNDASPYVARAAARALEAIAAAR
jgi:hypothetical protein